MSLGNDRAKLATIIIHPRALTLFNCKIGRNICVPRKYFVPLQCNQKR